MGQKKEGRLLEEGQIIRGTYEVEKFLGAGAFAEVYRVKHRFLGRQALKIFKRQDMTLPELEKALGEAMLLSRIGHPNIIRVFDANTLEMDGRVGGVCGYFTMEFVSGGTLDRFWHSFGMRYVPIETTVDLVRQVCRGLAVAHAEKPPIIHRDIKPQNILVGYEANGLRARLSDFGLAKQANPMTLMLSAAGTLAFKPPEVFENPKGDSASADIFAIGVTLYLLLTDRFPYELDPALGWAKHQESFKQEVEPPSYVNFDVDKELDSIVMRCLELEPANRYASVQELLKALEGWTYKEPPVEGAESIRSTTSKMALGNYTPIDAKKALELARRAKRMAREEGLLMEAADLMEEAFNQSPELREKYANSVKLWRAGISM